MLEKGGKDQLEQLRENCCTTQRQGEVEHPVHNKTKEG